jgi:DNA-binding transcriptional regulator YdaS (Cro superfamily)
METPNLAALRRAIEICGSQRALAAALQISPVAVGQWLLDTDNQNHRHVPPKQCVRIEQLTCGRVGRRELRPHDWAEWWPVDANPSATPAISHPAQGAINSEAKEAAHV